jgi:hypothetical protein
MAVYALVGATFVTRVIDRTDFRDQGSIEKAVKKLKTLDSSNLKPLQDNGRTRFLSILRSYVPSELASGDAWTPGKWDELRALVSGLKDYGFDRQTLRWKKTPQQTEQG